MIFLSYSLVSACYANLPNDHRTDSLISLVSLYPLTRHRALVGPLLTTCCNGNKQISNYCTPPLVSHVKHCRQQQHTTSTTQHQQHNINNTTSNTINDKWHTTKLNIKKTYQHNILSINKQHQTLIRWSPSQNQTVSDESPWDLRELGQWTWPIRRSELINCRLLEIYDQMPKIS